jgi:hypothetical protein
MFGGERISLYGPRRIAAGFTEPAKALDWAPALSDI